MLFADDIVLIDEINEGVNKNSNSREAFQRVRILKLVEIRLIIQSK